MVAVWAATTTGGAVIGGAFGLAGYVAAARISGQELNVRDALAATGAGAISGGIAGASFGWAGAATTVAGAILRPMAVGAGSKVVGGIIGRSVDSSDSTEALDIDEILSDTQWGGLAAGIGQVAGDVYSGVRPFTRQRIPPGKRAARRARQANEAGAARQARRMDTIGAYAGALVSNFVSQVSYTCLGQEYKEAPGALIKKVVRSIEINGRIGNNRLEVC